MRPAAVQRFPTDDNQSLNSVLFADAISEPFSESEDCGKVSFGLVEGSSASVGSPNSSSFRNNFSISNGPLGGSHSNASLASILAPEARRLQVESDRLLGNDSGGGTDDGELAPGSLAKTVTGWMRNAANFITLEPSRTTRLGGKSVSANIVHRHHSNMESSGTKVVNATDSICAYPNCIQSLNIAVSRFNCRRCNGWYCGQHAGHPSLGMKLRLGSGEPDSVNGIWSRVCQRCFQEKYYYLPASNPNRDLTAAFLELRKQTLEAWHTESLVLQGRLKALASYQPNTHPSFRVYERKIVAWEGDRAAEQCKNCQMPFTPVNRRHHCRLCGRLTCGAPSCSTFHPLSIKDGSIIDLRICTQCEDVAITRTALCQELLQSSDLLPLQAEMQRIKGQIDDILPRFNEQLGRFQLELDALVPIEERLLAARHEALTARDTLILLFRHFETVARRIRDRSEGCSLQETQLGQNIFRAALLYLQTHMFTLQMLPRLELCRLQKPIPLPIPIVKPTTPNHKSASTTSSIRRILLPRLLGGGESFPPTTAPPIAVPPPANLATLQEKISVLIEQKDQLESFLANAVQAQRFDDVRSLRYSLEDISRELANTNRILRNL